MSRTEVTKAGRVGRRWREVQAQVFAQETVCWLCGWPVDQSLPPRTPMSRTVDHVVPLAQGGAPLDRKNLRLAHLKCNSRKGDGTNVVEPRSSRRW